MSGYHAILLAAGAGSRFGGRKLLAAWQGEPLVRAAARTALTAPVDSCVATTGCDAAAVEAALEGRDAVRLRTLRVAGWEEGIAASLRAGLAALPPDSRGAVVFLGDMPLVPSDAAAALIAALEAGAAAAEMVHEGQPAHPVAFGTALFPALAALRGDRGGRGLLAGRTDVTRVSTPDAGAAFDVDVPRDLARGIP